MPGAHGDVEHRDGLVGDEQRRAEHQAAGDGHPLALAAGELVRVPLREGLDRREADLLQGVAHGRRSASFEGASPWMRSASAIRSRVRRRGSRAA